jgi:hypothetical protein
VDPSALSYAPSFIRGLNDLPLRFQFENLFVRYELYEAAVRVHP